MNPLTRLFESKLQEASKEDMMADEHGKKKAAELKKRKDEASAPERIHAQDEKDPDSVADQEEAQSKVGLGGKGLG